MSACSGKCYCEIRPNSSPNPTSTASHDDAPPSKNPWDVKTLTCQTCQAKVHTGCLTTLPPSSLQHDFLFEFKCSSCGENGEETYTRPRRIPWVHTVILLLHNLQSLEPGWDGFFHYKKNITELFGRNVSRLMPYESGKRNYATNIASCLSSYNGTVFVTGLATLRTHGWWKLKHNAPPFLTDVYKRASAISGERQETMPAARSDSNSRSIRKKKKLSDEYVTDMKKLKPSSSSKKRTVTSRVTAHFSTVATKLRVEDDQSDELIMVDNVDEDPSLNQSPLLSVNSESRGVNDLLSSSVNYDDDRPIMSSLHTFESTDADRLDWTNDIMRLCDSLPDSINPLSDLNEESQSSTVTERAGDESSVSSEHRSLIDGEKVQPVNSASASPHSQSDLDLKLEHCWSMSDSVNSSDIAMVRVKEEPSVSVQASPVDEADSADGNDDDDEGVDNSDKFDSRPVTPAPAAAMALPQACTHKIRKWTVYEEECLRLELDKKYGINRKLTPKMEMIRQVLHVRKIKRSKRLPVFSLSSYTTLSDQTTDSDEQDRVKDFTADVANGEHVLDRYQSNFVHSAKVDFVPFISRLHGQGERLKVVRSPYTARLLKPFIWRDWVTKPPKLQLLEEIRKRRIDVEGAELSGSVKDSIDYKYASAEHIPVINRMCHDAFWPGIDLSECLQYPDSSCVAMYKKLVVGFAFMVPDVSHNEAYISFIYTHPEWRTGGIASVMLYHLTQTCMGKDITLHVSANNPATSLYHKFGFRIVKMIRNFYLKYHPADCSLSPHALLLKLDRY